MKSIEEEYGLKSKQVELKRVYTKSGKALDLFPSPLGGGVRIEFPEFTSLCPKTGQPDFATITLIYEPKAWCVEMKSLKYYLNSLRNEGHFYEEVIQLIYDDLYLALTEELSLIKMCVVGNFNARGGTFGIIYKGDTSLLQKYPKP